MLLSLEPALRKHFVLLKSIFLALLPAPEVSTTLLSPTPICATIHDVVICILQVLPHLSTHSYFMKKSATIILNWLETNECVFLGEEWQSQQNHCHKKVNYFLWVKWMWDIWCGPRNIGETWKVRTQTRLLIWGDHKPNFAQMLFVFFTVAALQLNSQVF